MDRSPVSARRNHVTHCGYFTRVVGRGHVHVVLTSVRVGVGSNGTLVLCARGHGYTGSVRRLGLGSWRIGGIEFRI